MVLTMMADESLVTPEDLARELGYSGRTIRQFLRETYPEHLKYQRWELTPAQAQRVREQFGGR